LNFQIIVIVIDFVIVVEVVSNFGTLWLDDWLGLEFLRYLRVLVDLAHRRLVLARMFVVAIVIVVFRTTVRMPVEVLSKIVERHSKVHEYVVHREMITVFYRPRLYARSHAHRRRAN
jgi:hypothetical protein